MERLGWQEGDSRRVTWAPNARLIRYYTTLGLLDRAAHFEGRTAFYSSKHLLQILAIKYLQLGGRKLEEIQPILLGLTESALARLIGLEGELPVYLGDDPSPSQPAARRADFWAEVPETRPTLQLLTSAHPLPGVQILIDPQQLPPGINAEDILKLFDQLKHERG